MCDVGLEPLSEIVERLLAGLEKDRGIRAPASHREYGTKERATCAGKANRATSGLTAATPGSGDVAHAASL